MDPHSSSDTNRGPQILAVCITFISLALIFTGLRMWARVAILKQFWIDDLLILLASAVMLAQMVLIILQVQYGAGRHVDTIEHDDNITGLRLNFVTQPLCLIALVVVKVSIGILLTRLTTSTNFKRFIWGTIVFTILAFVGNFLTVVLQCQPLALAWDTSVKGQCMAASNSKFAAFFNSTVSVFTDLIFAILPAVLLWKVQLSPKRKMAIIPVLSLGFFATIAGVIKMLYQESYGKAGDFLYDSSNITIWITVEICLAIVVACSHALKTLVKATSGERTRTTEPAYQYNDSTSATRRTARNNIGLEIYIKSAQEGSPDADSQQNILMAKESAQDGIKRTTQLEVNVSEEQSMESASTRKQWVEKHYHAF